MHRATLLVATTALLDVAGASFVAGGCSRSSPCHRYQHLSSSSSSGSNSFGSSLLSFSGAAGHVQRRRAATMLASLPAECVELKEELLEMIDEEVAEGSRGVNTPAEVATDILEVVSELDDNGQGAVEWPDSPLLAGTWRLIYTSSRTFANNEGLSGYARDINGVETPELLMKLETQFKRITFEEPLTLQEGSLAALFGRFAGAKCVQVECVWQPTSAGVLAVTSQRVVVGSNSWEPADRQDKAVRALGAGRPIFLDEELLVRAASRLAHARCALPRLAEGSALDSHVRRCCAASPTTSSGSLSVFDQHDAATLHEALPVARHRGAGSEP